MTDPPSTATPQTRARQAIAAADIDTLCKIINNNPDAVRLHKLINWVEINLRDDTKPVNDRNLYKIITTLESAVDDSHFLDSYESNTFYNDVADTFRHKRLFVWRWAKTVSDKIGKAIVRRFISRAVNRCDKKAFQRWCRFYTTYKDGDLAKKIGTKIQKYIRKGEEKGQKAYTILEYTRNCSAVTLSQNVLFRILKEWGITACNSDIQDDIPLLLFDMIDEIDKKIKTMILNEMDLDDGMDAAHRI